MKKYLGFIASMAEGWIILLAVCLLALFGVIQTDLLHSWLVPIAIYFLIFGASFFVLTLFLRMKTNRNKEFEKSDSQVPPQR